MRMVVPALLLAAAVIALAVCALGAERDPVIPEPRREFRATWVATVDNIDWPSKPGLTTAEQKAELIRTLDRAVGLKMNAIILQVRPACDALYASSLEPWSEFLTGTMGQAPEPYYDPLEFAVSEAHRRGLELHAWFNPYRARHPAGKSAVSPDHISRTRPELVKHYGKYLWLDPGDPAVQEYSLAVIRDVVRRYDLDGVHIDDYFYPYKEKGPDGAVIPFPDDSSWAEYRADGGRLSRDNWRRDSVNSFVRRLYRMVKDEKKWVKFGISPFGIWRPGHPPQIRGMDQYSELYADARKWLVEGWCDYYTPQLYWRIRQTAQSYPVLLSWWADQNQKRRHMWPGSSLTGVATGTWPAEEIANQIRIARNQEGVTGNVFFSAKTLVRNGGGLSELLAKDLYSSHALVPASRWLDDDAPKRPKVTTNTVGDARALELSWQPDGEEAAWLWLVRIRAGGKWHTEVLPAHRMQRLLTGPLARADFAAVSAVDRCGNDSRPATLHIR